MIRTFKIEKKGRKYFQALLAGKYPSQLVINEVSSSLKVGDTALFEVKELAVAARTYEPLRSVTEEEFKGRKELAEAEKWLGYAESDAASGKSRSNAQAQALTLAAKFPQLDSRLAALKAKIALNHEADRVAEAEKWLGYAESDAASGKSRSNAQAQALTLAAKFPQLAERLAALKAKIALNHEADAKEKREEERKKAMRFFEMLESLPPLNRPTRRRNEVVVVTGYGKDFYMDDEEADGWGFYMGGGRGCYCYYREATEEEIAALEAEEAAAKEARRKEQERKDEIAKVAKKIKSEGEYPQGHHVPEGTRHHDTMTIYGGGSWFVIGAEWIWYVQNNGADGDDWGHNNVRTGGAGAIGWRIPFNEELAETIRNTEKNG
jgi:hypothetical protein